MPEGAQQAPLLLPPDLRYPWGLVTVARAGHMEEGGWECGEGEEDEVVFWVDK